ncbi:MAG: RbsD/FucU domain-containing protein [Pseudomonadota bacterium]
MLHGIDPKLTPELLYCLARMGHGDELVVADANYPSTTTAATCRLTEVLHCPGCDAVELVRLITDLMPLDGFHDYAALRMEIDKAPDEMSAVHEAAWAVMAPCLPEGGVLASIERQDFYGKAARAFAVVQCTEMRPFSCFILRKGVIF